MFWFWSCWVERENKVKKKKKKRKKGIMVVVLQERELSTEKMVRSVWGCVFIYNMNWRKGKAESEGKEQIMGKQNGGKAYAFS